MPDIALSLSFPVIFLVAAALAAAAVSALSYRRTNPPVSPSRRFLLGSLRTAGLFLVFLLLGEPLLSFFRTGMRPPVLVVLLDTSRSMTMEDRDGPRSAQLLAALTDPGVRNLLEESDTRYLSFGERPRLLDPFHADSLRFSSNGTDFTSALRAATRMSLTENVAAAILLTDGNNTTPGNPLFEPEALGLPVFAIGIGDTAERRDLVIRKVTTNAVVHAGTRVPVHVQIKSSGATGERAVVALRKGTTVLDQQEFISPRGTGESQLTLFYTPDEPGSRRYSVEIPPLPGEITTGNNAAGFVVKVIDRKASVLLLAGAPSPDVAFVRRILEADSALSVTVETGLNPPDLRLLPSADCIILIGFPTGATPPAFLEAIRSAVLGGSGLLFIPSRTMNLPALSALAPVLPFTVEDPSISETSVFLHPLERPLDPLLNLGETSGTDAWQSLPPVFTPGARFRPKPEATVHAVLRTPSGITREPLVLSRNVNRVRSASFLAYGLWRWTMLVDQTASGVLDRVILNSVRWLTTREEDRRLRVAPRRDMFTEGEPVEFEAQVYDESFQPVNNARVTVTAHAGGRTFETALDPLGYGQFAGALYGIPRGDHTFEAVVTLGGLDLGRWSGSFAVGESSIEFLETRLNAHFLRQLADRTGGRAYSPQDLGSLADDVRSLGAFRPREVTSSSDLPLWDHTGTLLAVLALFVAEWILRKQGGLL